MIESSFNILSSLNKGSVCASNYTDCPFLKGHYSFKVEGVGGAPDTNTITKIRIH